MKLQKRDHKKILFILPSLGDGGSETSLLNVLRMFVKNHHDVHLIIEKKPTSGNSKDSETLLLPEGAEIHFLNKKFMGGSSSKFLRKIALSGLIRRLDKEVGSYDLILSNYITSSSFVEKFFPHKVYYWVHFDFRNQMRKSYEASQKKGDKFRKKIIAYFNKKNLIFVSHGASDFLLSLPEIKPRNSVVIYNTFDIKTIRNLSLETQKKIPKHPYIVHIARLDVFQKRQDILFEAFKSINPSYKLVLLTRPSRALYEMIEKAGLEDRVIVAGYQENPYPWIKHAQLLVLCSDYEGLPMCLIESLICNTEIVSTDCPSGPAEILDGFLADNLVPCNDAQAFADKVNEVLANSSPEKTLEAHIRKFSQEFIFPQYLALIKDN